MSFETPSGLQRAALQQAASRPLGAPWRGPRLAAERCCDFGWLEPVHLAGCDPTDINGLVYQLTPAGRAALARSEIGNAYGALPDGSAPAEK